ncbi:MAG: hypothetical protein A3F14_00785 [Gammaproteobacteria bacterium RIFCSPHIGHO2_12_FULL_43_28]|nr:MAG: hypothetical protein A3F14_00785 [Gammaproteobacteria bacterium RIFCSPHIGHO2_12_FULL_43_28]
MSLKPWIRFILIGGVAASLVACSSMHKKTTDESTINEANAAYQGEAQASGIGDESSFGDRADSSMQKASDRVYYFAYDSDVIRASDMPVINAHANYLLTHSRAKIMLEGHTDPRGSREYNIGLGERRAKAVSRYMMSKGVSPTQIRVVSYGAEKLASPARTEAAYQLDRRVVLVYTQR